MIQIPNRLGYGMVTVDRFAGYRIVIYKNDHRPAHVHVIGNGREAIFQLEARGKEPALRDNFGFSKRDLQRVQKAISEKHATLWKSWRKIHG